MSVEAERLRLVFHSTSHLVLWHESHGKFGVIFIEVFFFKTQAIKPRPSIMSAATFDSSDMSDTDSEAEAESSAAVSRQGTRSTQASSLALTANAERVPRNGHQGSPIERQNGQNVAQDASNDQQNTEQSVPDSTDANSTPFGLPAQLRLAALARRHHRVLRARSNRYLWILITVATFYALPVMQFVAAFQVDRWTSATTTCAHPAGQVSDFNHVFRTSVTCCWACCSCCRSTAAASAARRHPLNDVIAAPLPVAFSTHESGLSPLIRVAGVRHPGALRSAVLAGRGHDGGGAAVGHLSHLPQQA
ncbi:SID1 transmembrane family member 2 [Eumeta japonica]|uniref:SID1 transmembrane family member 2 n=1 Tax=Eumeta variegata TaxID=151549 RepID=A0A4C2AD50_EUMVA|nr:SID1 transmembrane family member 2 [Eumeta japonica]